MSMLAERRRKQRFTLNPRGKSWTEDTNRFGQKIMQKMGWKHGKGLGANEDGMTESLKVSYKSDNKGMGYKEVEQWTAHDDQFSTLLQNLNSNIESSTGTKEIASLEEKSQNSRARIHYHKFTKGKDLSKYSEKDLANIFGKKTLKQNVVKQETIAETETKPVEDKNDTTLINKGSMTDYFKRKLPNFRKNNSNYIIGNNGVLRKEISDSENERIGFGFAQNKRKRIDDDEETTKCDENIEQNVTDLNETKKKKQKRKRMNENFVSYVYKDNANTNEDEIEQDTVDELIEGSKKINEEYAKQDDEEFNGVKKKKKEKRRMLDENYISHVDKETKMISGNMKENDEEVVEVSKNKIKQKKKRRKDELDQIELDRNMCDSKNENKCEERLMDSKIGEENNIEKPKKKKLKKSKLTEENTDIVSEEMEIKTKKKKNHSAPISVAQHDSETNIGINDNSKDEESANINKKQKKSKKKKKEECGVIGITNLAFNDFNNSASILNDSLQDDNKEENIQVEKKKKHKHQRKSNAGIDNPLFDISATTDTSNTSVNPCEVKVEKESHTKDIGFDNPALNVSDILDTDLMLNIINTPVILKKPVKPSDIMSSIEKLRRSKRKSVRFNDVLQERIIPNDPSERTNEYITNRNELFDINTMVIEESVKEDMEKQGLVYQNGSSPSNVLNINDQGDINRKVVESSVQEELSRAENCGFINNGFDIRSVDKVNFYECKYEVRSPKTKGIDNKAFNEVKNFVEENVETISNTIERYQAEIENDINECKANINSSSTPDRKMKIENFLVGDVGEQIDRNIKVEEGSKLCFKDMHFKTRVPGYMRNTANTAKKTYRHLIRGDITVAFKNSNLHDIQGYAVKMKEKSGC